MVLWELQHKTTRKRFHFNKKNIHGGDPGIKMPSLTLKFLRRWYGILFRGLRRIKKDNQKKVQNVQKKA